MILPWVPEAFHVRFPVSSRQSDLYGAMGFAVLNSNLPNQTDSYAVQLSCHLVHKGITAVALAFLYALLLAFIKSISYM